MRVRWTEPAAITLESIQDYIARDNPPAAFEVAKRIRVAVSQLEEHPKIGRAGRVSGTYELVIHALPYRAVLYQKERGPDPECVAHVSKVAGDV